MLIGQELPESPHLSLTIVDSFYFNRVPQKLVCGSVFLFNNSLSMFSSKPGKVNFFRVFYTIPFHVFEFPFSTNNGWSIIWFIKIILTVRKSEKKYR